MHLSEDVGPGMVREAEAMTGVEATTEAEAMEAMADIVNKKGGHLWIGKQMIRDDKGYSHV